MPRGQSRIGDESDVVVGFARQYVEGNLRHWKEELDKLNAMTGTITKRGRRVNGHNGHASAPATEIEVPVRKKKRKMSPEAKERIRAAVVARWARVRAEKSAREKAAIDKAAAKAAPKSGSRRAKGSAGAAPKRGRPRKHPLPADQHAGQ